MGVRESLLNTITSVADSDFVRIVTSAGASSKATVANLFKSFESNLGAKTSLTTSDYIRVVGSDNASYKQSMASVKNTLGIDALANKITPYSDTSADSISNLILGKFNYVKGNGTGIYLLSGGWASRDFGFSLVWVQSSTRGIVIFFATSEAYHGYINGGAVTSVRKFTSTPA